MDTAVDRKPWLKSYPPGVPADMPRLEYENIPRMLEASVSKYRKRLAFESFGVRLSFDELDLQSRNFAAYLQSGLGLKKGDRVAMMMPNILQYPVAVHGILRAGLTVVSVNPLYTARELEHQLMDSGAIAIVIFESAAHTLQEVITRTPVKHVVVAAIGDMLGLLKGTLINFVFRRVKKMVKPWQLDSAVGFPDAVARGGSLAFSALAIAANDLAFLQYTGGTTGVSKGTMLHHRHVLSNVRQIHTYFRSVLREGEEIAIAPLPFYHTLALVLDCMLITSIGGMQVLVANPRDIPGFIKTLAKSRFTFFVGVNTLFNALNNHPDFVKLDFSQLRLAGGGGAPVQMSVAKRWKEITGRALSEGYGLTETTGAVSINRHDMEEHTGTTGLPLPGTEVEIRDENGKPLPIGEIGEVCVRGPQVMAGYWQRPEETAKVLGADGFLATGDVGLLTPEGYLKIVDRMKDMVLVSGFNVYPNEIEEVLTSHPDVLEAAVIGVPDDVTGEAVKAFIVRKNPGLNAEEVNLHCRKNMTGYKVPKHVEFRESLPKSPVGKILRRELRDAAK